MGAHNISRFKQSMDAAVTVFPVPGAIMDHLVKHVDGAAVSGARYRYRAVMMTAGCFVAGVAFVPPFYAMCQKMRETTNNFFARKK
ncbi:MAG: hypothetical protein IK105_10375 [Thermoguttaceae bacterium]|nr:hypothetical protein [Thermoguttaceae bacterium]